MIPVLAASIIFALSLYLIFSEKLDRTVAAIAGASLMVVAGLILGFYTEEQAIESLDMETLGLLLGMMTLVALLEPTGFFQYLAVWGGKLSRGQPVRLLIMLGAITTLLSMFLDNVTTVVLIAPVTILISEILGICATPLLITEALLSNTGGTATLVGDPPNVLIGSASGLSFNDFLTHSLPVVVVCWLVALWALRYLFRAELAQKPKNVSAILQLNPEEALDDRVTARKVLIILGVAIAAFFLQEVLRVSPAVIALSAAAVSLVWVKPDIHATLKRIEWGVLIFFASLFIMVGGLEHAGVLHGLTSLLSGATHLPGPFLGVLMIWVVAVLSAVVDNVPITIALIPVIHELGASGINAEPLWWALVFGAGFGGNATIIGSSANVVVASLSERTRIPITSKLWSKSGLPVMLLTCFVASILYMLLYPLFTR